MKNLKEYCIERISLLKNDNEGMDNAPDSIVWAIESRIIELHMILIEFCDMSEEEVDSL